MSAPDPLASPRRVSKRDFDAALVPGFREATRQAYDTLTANAASDMSATLDDSGRFLASVEIQRDCPLCGSPRAEARGLFDKLGMRIVRCPRCALVYSANVLTRQYDHQRYVASASQSGYQALKRLEAYASLERVKCRYVAEKLSAFRPQGGRFLEIGPGAGRLLDAARDAGWMTCGVEVNPRFVKEARERGHTMVEGAFPADLPEGTPFQAIALLDVLEHLHEPLQALRECASRLAPGGVLIVQVPNVESLLLQLEGPASMNYCHGHWNHFAPETLERMAAAAGLAALELDTIISEIDRIRAFGPEAIRKAALELRGAAPPPEFDADWLHAHGMGFKVLGYFARGSP